MSSDWLITFGLGVFTGGVIVGTWLRARQDARLTSAYQRGADDARTGLAPRRPLDLTHPAVRRERGAATLLGPLTVFGLVLLVPVLGWLSVVAVGSLAVAVFAADQLREVS